MVRRDALLFGAHGHAVGAATIVICWPTLSVAPAQRQIEQLTMRCTARLVVDDL